MTVLPSYYSFGIGITSTYTPPPPNKRYKDQTARYPYAPQIPIPLYIFSRHELSIQGPGTVCVGIVWGSDSGEFVIEFGLRGIIRRSGGCRRGEKMKEKKEEYKGTEKKGRDR